MRSSPIMAKIMVSRSKSLQCLKYLTYLICRRFMTSSFWIVWIFWSLEGERRAVVLSAICFYRLPSIFNINMRKIYLRVFIYLLCSLFKFIFSDRPHFTQYNYTLWGFGVLG